METATLYNGTTRAANLLTLAQSEVPTAANGWLLAAGIATAAASANTGPYGFGLGVPLTSAASGARQYTRPAPAVMPAGGVTMSLFVRHGTCDNIRLGLTDSTSGAIPSFDYAWDSTLRDGAGGWKNGAIVSAALGGPIVADLDNGWQRIAITVIPGLTTTVAAGDTYVPLIQLQIASKTLDIFGVMIENNPTQAFNGNALATDFAVTSFGINPGDRVYATVGGVLTPISIVNGGTRQGFTARFGTAPATGTSNVVISKAPTGGATPYLTNMGMWGPDVDRQSLPVFRPQNSDDSVAVRQSLTRLGITGGTGTLALQVRAKPGLVWHTRVAPSDADGGMGTAEYIETYDPTANHEEVVLWPEMRVLITALGTGASVYAEITG